MRPAQVAALTLGVVVVGGAIAVGSYRVGLQRGTQASPASAAAGNAAVTPADNGADAKRERRVLYWHDPMVPGQRFDKPGKSPYMDMQLVPVYADEAGDSGGVNIDPRVQQRLGIRTALATMAKLSAPVLAVGTVAYNDRDVAIVTARNSGYVEKLYVRTTLQAVRRGQPLAQMYVPEWVAAQEEYLSARRLSDANFPGLAEAARQRMALTGMPESVIEKVEATLAVHPRFTVTAPIAGVVSELAAREGATLSMGMPLFRINGVDTVWVNAEVPEAAVQRVRPGAPAAAMATAFPDQSFRGTVTAILPEVNATTRTIKARLELRNPGGKLVPGMFVTVNFPAAAGSEAVVVPSEAVIRTGTRALVFIADGKGGFSPTEVEPGSEGNGQTEIRRGVSAGQSVVVSGQFLVDSEASLRGTQVRMQGESTAAAATNAPDHASDPAHSSGTAQHDAGAPARPAAPTSPTYQAEGTLEAIEGATVTLSHGPVPELKWPGMTMGFKVPPDGMPKGVQAGDAVRFTFRKAAKGGYEIVTIEKAHGANHSGSHQ